MYAHWVLAAGTNHSFFGHDEWALHAPGFAQISVIGDLAAIGHNSAVVDLSTRWALSSFRKRMVVLMDWAMAYSSFSRNARVVAETLYKKEYVGES